jgi:phospholipid/cholesterol/gamma-HCH transport system substrate-binding protein
MSTSIKLAAYLVVAVLATVITVNTLDPPLRGASRTHTAVFTDATGVVAGSDVRIAGVRVGKVTGVELVGTRGGRAAAKVGFDLEADQRVPAGARVAIRYADLLGARYLSILPGDGGPDLPAGGEIPLNRTQPALDLTAMLGGFKPLFDALEPAEINQFAAELVAVFQGEAGTVRSLLARTVSVTEGLSAKDAVLGSVLTNLQSIVDFSLTHRQDFRELLTGLATLAHGLAEDRQQIVDALDATSGLAASLADLVDELGPELEAAVVSADGASRTLVDNSAQLTEILRQTPGFLAAAGRLLDYGTWGNVYVCNLSVGMPGSSAGTAPVDLSAGPHSEVCR